MGMGWGRASEGIEDVTKILKIFQILADVAPASHFFVGEGLNQVWYEEDLLGNVKITFGEEQGPPCALFD